MAVEVARALMSSFATRTGLDSARPPRRYLWTDAFAVTNFLALGDVASALRLVDAVHAELGRGATGGGLRIGKPLPERGRDETYDSRLEWERDGQYFHYLTKWMHALAEVARVTCDATYLDRGRELAMTAHRAFVYGPPGRRRMYWKMSVDLSRPQVPSMGHHDPLDGYVTARELGDLDAIAADYRAMIDPDGLATDDALGLGGLLADAARLTTLRADEPLRDALVTAAAAGLRVFAAQRELEARVERRLAFRELGLAIGLSAVRTLDAARAVEPYQPLATRILGTWTREDSRASITYEDHLDINDVMLATALLASR